MANVYILSLVVFDDYTNTTQECIEGVYSSNDKAEMAKVIAQNEYADDDSVIDYVINCHIVH